MTWEQISSQSNGPGRKIRPTIANDRPNLPSSVNHSSATVGRSVFHSVDPSGSSFPPEASRHKQVITQTRKSAADPSGRRHNAELWKVARKNTILFTALAGGRTNGRMDGLGRPWWIARPAVRGRQRLDGCSSLSRDQTVARAVFLP